MATLAEQKAALLEQLASAEELQSGTDRIRNATKTQIIEAIREIERQEGLATGAARVVTTYAKVNRA